MALNLFGDRDGDVSRTRRRQIREARKRERQEKVSGVVGSVREKAREVKNRVRTGTKRGGSGERVPGYVESEEQRRKRVARRVREAMKEASETAREGGARGVAAAKARAEDIDLETAQAIAQEMEQPAPPEDGGEDVKRMFRNAERSAAMQAPVHARIDPAGDLGRGMWDFAAGTGGRREGPGEMAMAGLDMGGEESDEDMEDMGFGLVFGDEEEDDELMIDPLDVKGGLI